MRKGYFFIENFQLSSYVVKCDIKKGQHMSRKFELWKDD